MAKKQPTPPEAPPRSKVEVVEGDEAAKNFERLTRRLVSVPKSEIDAERAREDRKRA